MYRMQTKKAAGQQPAASFCKVWWGKDCC